MLGRDKMTYRCRSCSRRNVSEGKPHVRTGCGKTVLDASKQLRNPAKSYTQEATALLFFFRSLLYSTKYEIRPRQTTR